LRLECYPFVFDLPSSENNSSQSLVRQDNSHKNFPSRRQGPQSEENAKFFATENFNSECLHPSPRPRLVFLRANQHRAKQQAHNTRAMQRHAPCNITRSQKKRPDSFMSTVFVNVPPFRNTGVCLHQGSLIATTTTYFPSFKALSILRISDSLSPACAFPLFQSTTWLAGGVSQLQDDDR
jgi:hypothetical protein